MLGACPRYSPRAEDTAKEYGYSRGCHTGICTDYTWQELIRRYTFRFRPNSGVLGEGRHIFCLREVAIETCKHTGSLLELPLTPPHTLQPPLPTPAHLSLARCVSTLPWSVRRFLPSLNPPTFSLPLRRQLSDEGYGVLGA
jgi:hypothetical protein